MKLSIIIPCYNEKQYLPMLISLIKKSPVKEKEIILVDDGSDDGSTQLIRDKLEAEVDKVVFHESNLGKGAAIRSALKYVTGGMVIIQDADLEYNPQMSCMVRVSWARGPIACICSGIMWGIDFSPSFQICLPT